MNIEAIWMDWQSVDDPVDFGGVCPECLGDGKACELLDWVCPLCKGAGVYDEAFEALMDALATGAAHAESIDVA